MVATDTTAVGTEVQPNPLDFRTDLQWLRAVAVLIVFAYHLGIPGFDGGYVGVDVFFVLSGYLITRLLVHEAATTGSLDIRRFMLRRIRRLLPVSALVLFTTLGAMSVTMGSLRRAGEALVARSTAFFGANIGLALQETDYLTAGRESPLQHFWSLGVEEQFYLLWPPIILLLVIVAARTATDRTRLLAWSFAVLAVASLALAATWTVSSQPLAFFLLPARAWQLIAGGLLAVAELAGARPGRRAVLRWGGLLLLAGVTAAGTIMSFPWPLALVPVLATAAIIWGGVDQRRPPAWMAGRRMVWIGDRSYGLYLWHWPPLVLLGLTDEPWDSDPVLRVAIVLAVFVLTAATYRLVEQPLRGVEQLATPRWGFSVALGTVLVTFAVAVSVTGPAFRPAGELAVPSSLPDGLTPTLPEAVEEFPVVYENGCHAGADAEEPPPTAACTYGTDDPAAPTIALVGDSHAAMWFDGARAAADEEGWRLVVLTKSGCAIYDVDAFHGERPYPQCDAWRRAMHDRLAAIGPDVVVVSGLADPRHRDEPEDWAAGVRSAMTTLRERLPDTGFVLMLDTPLPEDDIPSCLDEQTVEACSFAPDQAFDDLQRGLALEVADAALDTPALLCDTTRCPPVIGDVLVYRDDDHLSGAASRMLASDLIGAVRDAHRS